MLITETARTAVFAGSIVVGLCGAGIALLRRRPGSSLAAARVVDRTQPSVVRHALQLLPFLCVALSATALRWASRHDIDVMLISDGHSAYGARAVERGLTSSTDEFSTASGDAPLDSLYGRPCWILNGSSKPIRRVRIEYPDKVRAHYVETGSVVILPGQRSSGCDVDYFGSELAPPETTEAMASSRLNFASWLTWD